MPFVLAQHGDMCYDINREDVFSKELYSFLDEFEQLLTQLLAGLWGYDGGLDDSARAQTMESISLENLRTKFGFDEFRCQEQRQAVDYVLEGDDVVVLAPTGMGKSICYLLPAWIRFARRKQTAIVVSPLLALQENQMAALRDRFRVPATALNSATKLSDRADIMKALRQGGVYAVLFVTPETAVSPQFRDLLTEMHRSGKVSLVAIDEAHCISEWGHDFRPAYRRLGGLFKQERFISLPMIALTATATKAVLTDVVSSLQLRSDRTRLLLQSFNRPNIYYEVRKKDNVDPPGLVDMLRFVNKNKDSCGIVYAATRDECESIGRAITGTGTACVVYHAGLGKVRRLQAQKQWEASDACWAVATVAFGMGIDKANVRCVIHWTMPKTMEGFYQESGRAGRDGNPSVSRVYFSEADMERMAYLTRTSRAEDEKVGEKELASLHKVRNYCTKEECRRKRILRHFDENFSPLPADNPRRCCDVCKKPTRRVIGKRNEEDSSVAIERPRITMLPTPRAAGKRAPEKRPAPSHGPFVMGGFVTASQLPSGQASAKRPSLEVNQCSGRSRPKKNQPLSSMEGDSGPPGKKARRPKMDESDLIVGDSVRGKNPTASSSTTKRPSKPTSSKGSLDLWLTRG